MSKTENPKRPKEGVSVIPAAQKRQRDRVFCAVVAVALDQGFGHVTMDAVARQAKLSKGGLLYYFPNKAELIQAMLARYSGWENTPQCKPDKGSSAGGIDPFAVAVLVAAAEDPSLLACAADCPGQEASGDDKAAFSARWRLFCHLLANRL